MSSRSLLGPIRAGIRAFGTSPLAYEPKKPSIKAIGELRKQLPGTSMIKAREALLASRKVVDQDDVLAALAWLQEDLAKSGAKKAAKVANRTVGEGVVAVSVHTDGMPAGTTTSQPQGALVEINCETDFVARSEIFGQLVRDIAHTAALFPALAGEAEGEIRIVDLPIDALLAFPLLSSSPEASASTSPKTISDAITDTVSRLGERISIARACAIQGAATPPADAPRRGGQSRILHLASAFTTGGASTSSIKQQPGYVLTTGRVASLLLTRLSNHAPDSARALVRSLARQTAGMNATSINDAATTQDGEPSPALYKQPFMMLLPTAAPTPESNSHPVQQVLKEYGQVHGAQVEVVQLKRWEMGETAEAPPQAEGDSFADEVRKAAGLA